MNRRFVVAIVVIALGVAILLFTPDWLAWGGYLGNGLVLAGVVIGAISLLGGKRPDRESQ